MASTSIRIHLVVAGIRTTATLDRILSALLSLHLVGRRDLQVVRTWCQEQVDLDPGAFASLVSQRLQLLMMLEIAPPSLKDAYWDTLDQPMKAERQPRTSSKKRSAKPPAAPRAKPAAKKRSAAAKPVDMLSVVRQLEDRILAMTSVPKVVRHLAKRMTVGAVHRVLLEQARAGIFELRPESGMGRLTREELGMCIPGPEGSHLSWIRVR